MKKMKQGPMEQLKRKRCKLKNHTYSKEEVRKRKNYKWIKNKNRWRPLQ
jgi:hypothetical protein